MQPPPGQNTMEPNKDIECEDKTARNRYPPEHLIRDVDEFFQGSSITKYETPTGIAKQAQDLLAGLIKA
jgi:hypothetical protein